MIKYTEITDDILYIYYKQYYQNVCEIVLKLVVPCNVLSLSILETGFISYKSRSKLIRIDFLQLNTRF